MWLRRSFLIILAVLAFSAQAEKCPSNKSNAKLFCYYGKLQDIDSCRCSHVILPPNSDVKSIENLRQSLQGVKILITVHEFNEGLVQLLKNTKVDGLEINLNKINSKEDIGDFITTAKSKLGDDLVTVVSVPPRADLLAKFYDFKGLSKHADAFILQTAFLGANKNYTFHPSRLSGLWDMQNADTVVDLVTGLGAPLSKLVIAAPVQAFQFKLQNKEHTAVGSPALEVQSITRDELCEKMENSEWTLERDQDQAGPYIFRKDEWIAFDDPTSMDIKAKYARVRGLAGLALKDLSQDGGKKCGGTLLEAAYTGLSKQARAPRGAVLHSLEREILESPAKPFANIQLSPYRITRIVDVEGKVHTVRQDTRTEFECSRQGYFVHPRSCNRFYRCVKFNQLSDEYNVFEFDCPAGLAFDSKVEVCVWPGSLSDGSACSGSSEIAPVPKERYQCPHEPGYYADPENCRWFFACLDHGESGEMTPYEFRCPFGLVFDQARLVCEWPWLVPKCGSGHISGGYQTVQFFGGHGQASNGQYYSLDSYNGIGALQPVALTGVSGKIEQSINKVYSSFANHGPQGGAGYYGNQVHSAGNAQRQGSLGYGVQLGAKEQGVITGGASSQGFGASSQGVVASSQGFGASSQGFGASSQGVVASSQGFGASSQGFGASSQGFGHGSGEATSSQYQTHQGNQGTTHQGSGILVEAQALGAGQSQSFSQNGGTLVHGGSSVGGYQQGGQEYVSGFDGSNRGSTKYEYHGSGSNGAGAQGSQFAAGQSQSFGQNGGTLVHGGSLVHAGSSVGGYQQGGQEYVSGFDGSNRGSTKYEYHGSGSNGAVAQGSQFAAGQSQSFGQNGGTLVHGGSLVHAGSSAGGYQEGGQEYASGFDGSIRGSTKYEYHGSGSNGAGAQGSQFAAGQSQSIGQNEGTLVHGGALVHGGSSAGGYQEGGQEYASGSNGAAGQGSQFDRGFTRYQLKQNPNHGSQNQEGVLIGQQNIVVGHGINAQEQSGEGYQANYNSNHGFQNQAGVGQNTEINHGVNVQENTAGVYQGNYNSNHGSQSHGVLIGTQDLNVNQGIETQGHSAGSYQFGNHENQANIAVNAQEINNGFSSNEGSSSQTFGQRGIKYTNTDAADHQVSFGFASGGFGHGIDLSGHQGSVYVNNAGSNAYSSQSNNLLTDQKVNIVGGGFSAVKEYGHHQVVQSVTPATIAVSTGIPTVTSVPLPGSVDLHQTGVVANVPELQVKINSPSEVNIHHGSQFITTTTTSAPEVSTGYYYEKPKVPFVDGQVEHQQTGYHYDKPSIVFAEKPQKTHLKEVVQTVFGVKNTGYNYPKPSIPFEEGKVQKPSRGYSYQHFNKAHVVQKQKHIQVPIVSTERYIEQPVHQIVQQPVVEQHVVPVQNTGEGHSYSYQNFGHAQQNEYVKVQQPVHIQEVVQPLVEVQKTVVQPHVEVQKTVVQPAQSFSYQSFGKGHGNQYVNTEQQGQQHFVEEVVQPHVEVQKTVVQPAQSFSYQTFGKGHGNQFVNTEQQGQQHIVEEVVQPNVEVQKTVVQPSVVQPAHSFSYQSFGKAHGNQYVNTEQQGQKHIVEEVVQPHVELQKTVVQPAQSFSYQSFGKAQSNQYINTEQQGLNYVNTEQQGQQHIVEEVTQPHVELQKTIVQPAQSFSYQSFGKAHGNQYVNTEQQGQQHIVEEVLQPQVELQKTVVQPAQSFSYQSFGKAQSNQYVNTEQQGLNYVNTEHQGQQNIVEEVLQPQVEVQKTVVQPAQSFSYQSFGKAHSNHYVNTEQQGQQHIVEEVVQPHVELQKTVVQPAVVQSAHSFSHQSFGKGQNNQYVNTEQQGQQHIVEELVQPHVELQKTVVQPAVVQSAHSFSHQSFGKGQNNQYVNTEQQGQQHIVEELVQPHVELQKTVVQPAVVQSAHSFSHQSFGKGQNNQYVNTEQQGQQHIVEELVQPHVELQKTVVQPAIVQPAHSFSYQSFGKTQNNQYINTEQQGQQHIVEEVVQPHVELQKTVVQPAVVQPAHSFSYQSFGKTQNNQYVNTEQQGLDVNTQQHIVEETVQPQVELQKTVTQPAHSYSYQSYGKKQNTKVVQPIIQQEVVQTPIHEIKQAKTNVQFQSHVFQPVEQVVQKQPAQTYSYVSFGKQHEVEQPLVQQEITDVKIDQPVVTEKTNSYTYFGTHKQNHKYGNVEQAIQQEVVVDQQPEVQTYGSFGVKEQNQVVISSTVAPAEQYEQEGYHYPKPQESVKEEPFIAKHAYVTGQSYYHQKSNLLGTYSLSENGGYISSTPAFEEAYVSSTPKYQEPTQEIFYQTTSAPEVSIDRTRRPVYVQTTPRKLYVKTAKQTVYVPTTEASYYLSSTPAPTFQSTLSTLVDKEPLKFYLYDSRLSSKSTTAPEEVIASTYKPLKNLKSGRPIARYEFSSLDSGYSSTPPIEVTSQRRRPTKPSNAYLPVKVSSTTPYIEVTSTIKPERNYLPSIGTAGMILENYQANYEEGVSRRPVKVVKVVRPGKSKAIVKINDFHPMLSAKLGGQCTCVSNTVSLRKNPIQVDDGDDGYIVDGPEYDTQKIVEITPASEVVVSSTPKSIVVRKRVKSRPTTTASYEEAPVSKSVEYFIKSTRKPDDDDEPSDHEVKQAVKTVKKLVKAAAKQGAKEGTKEALKDFDRYGPGGVRSRIETLQGIDCQRAGLFRHPTQCNKFYSCRWDCDKNKFTLHVFNCPVHLTFDSNLGACNWPSQGPACSGNTLLPSD